jgi:threonine/homoserine/homoserine lactone efflux protein
VGRTSQIFNKQLTEAILQGVVLGLFLTALIGPVFFILIETSLRRGVRPALYIDLGVFVSDVSAIFLAYWFTSSIEDAEKYHYIMQIVGGGMFTVFGLVNLFTRKKVPPAKRERLNVKPTNTILTDILKGFMLNALNPSVVFFWLAMVAVAQKDFGDDQSHVLAFFVSLLFTFFAFDVLKIFLASYLKRFITARLLLVLNKIMGLGLIIFGGILIWKGIIAS